MGHEPGPGTPLDTDSTTDSSAVADRILAHLFRFRRSPQPPEPCALQPCATCFAVHRPKVEAFVRAGRPVEFVIAAFPAKSPNRRKTLGSLPDLGERLALEFLQSFCEQIGHFHPPGARITVCSDGHVFGDLVGVPDEEVTAYHEELESIIGELGGQSLRVYSLRDAFGGADYERLRDQLVAEHATPIDELHDRVRTDPAWRHLFDGMHRFMVEDQTVLRPEASRSSVRRDCKHLALQVIQRSNAWSEVVAETFPAAVRLSIHPQPHHSAKIGVHMLRTRDAWLTPWHGTVLDDGQRLTLVKRAEAERLDATLAYRRGRPSHFVAPHLAPPLDAVERPSALQEVPA